MVVVVFGGLLLCSLGFVVVVIFFPWAGSAWELVL